jgi:naphthalene 1,2-dioxygenase system ferredoxin subunit
MANWISIATADEVEAAGGLLGRSAGGVRVALYGVDGAYYATADICTHGQALLSEGYLEDHLIECPLHQGLFDIRTGEVKGPPCTQAIASFPVRREGGDLLVDLGSAAAGQG